jgi:putative flippase GtrA
MLHEWLLVPEIWAFACSISLAFIISFLSFRYVVLENARQQSATKQLGSFLIASACFRASEYVVFLILHLVLGLYYIVSVVIVLTASFFAKFFFYRRNVFVQRRSN